MKNSVLITFMLMATSLIYSQGDWIEKANITGARYGAFGFSIGTKCYIGGGETLSGYRSDFWEYNPATDVWTQKASYTIPTYARSRGVGFNIGDKGYTACGVSAESTVYNALREYDTTTNAWVTRSTYPGSGRWELACFTIGNKAYVGTGSIGVAYFNDFYEYDQSTDSWTQKASYPGGHVRGATGFSIGNKGYFGTGSDEEDIFKDDFYEYDPAANSWTQKANYAGGARSWGVGFGLSGYGYLGCGADSDWYPVGDFYKYDPATNSWSSVDDIPTRSYAVAFSTGNKGYCGTGLEPPPSNTFFEFDICGTLMFTFNKTDVICNGENNGTITVNATGGTLPYQYSIDGGIMFQSSNVFTNLVPDNYYIVVSDTINCVSDTQTTIVTEPEIISFTASQLNVNCFGGNDGSITVDATGGIPPYQYSKDNGSNFQTSNVFQNLIAGNYLIVVKDSNLCVSNNQAINLTEPEELLFTTTQVNVICFAGNNGSITVEATGGTPPYQYSKDNGNTFQSSNIFLNLAAGNYFIVIKDMSNCVSNAQLTIITEPEPLLQPTITASGPLTFCVGDSVILTSSFAYAYLWSNGDTTQSTTVYTTLIISITIFDTLGCTAVSNPVSITVNNLPPTPTISVSGNILISSSTTGNQWYYNDTLIYGANSQTYEAFQSGYYSVEVTNSYNCKSISVPFYFLYTGIINSALAQVFNIYPNPSRGIFHLNFEYFNNPNIKVFNLLGEIVFQSQSKISEIDLSSKPKGVYIILIISDGIFISEKLVLL